MMTPLPPLQSNMRKAMRESLTVDTHLRCVDHIINTCVTKALEEDVVSQAIQKCKDLASATHRSSLKTEKLRLSMEVKMIY
jgi:hypothetical protein